jgi:signal transduction histidine kinase
MRSDSFLKKILFWYVALSIFIIVFLQILHLKFVQSCIIEQTDRALVQEVSFAANLLGLLETQHATEGEIRTDLEKLTNQLDSRLSIEIIDSHDESFFRSPRLDPDISFVKFGNLANNEIRVVDFSGQQLFRIFTKKVDGFTLFAGYPQATFSELISRNISDNRYLGILFSLLVAFTGFFIYSFFVRPVHELNLHLNNLLRQSLSSEPIKTPRLIKSELGSVIEKTLKMVERLHSARNQALNFSSFASHELRTPLTIIRNQLEDALSSNIPPRTLRKLVGGVYDEMLRLNNTVESLLNLSTMQAGTFALNRESIPVQRFFKDFYDEAFILTRPKNIAVVLGKGPELYIHGDAARIRQVFFNLLDNAVKNTPENHRIWLSYEQEQEQVLIKFADSGNGIPPHLLPRIFEPFVRGNETANDNRGAGLGLALVKLIVDLHGGSISVESEVGTGTTFFLRFPSTIPVERMNPPETPLSPFKTM